MLPLCQGHPIAKGHLCPLHITGRTKFTQIKSPGRWFWQVLDTYWKWDQFLVWKSTKTHFILVLSAWRGGRASLMELLEREMLWHNWKATFPPKFENKHSESLHAVYWLWEHWIFLGKSVFGKVWGAGPGSWIERGFTAANIPLKGMSWGASWVISWFGKLKESSNLFEEGPFMFPLWFGAVSKTLGFQNPKQTAPKQRSL